MTGEKILRRKISVEQATQKGRKGRLESLEREREREREREAQPVTMMRYAGFGGPGFAGWLVRARTKRRIVRCRTWYGTCTS